MEHIVVEEVELPAGRSAAAHEFRKFEHALAAMAFG